VINLTGLGLVDERHWKYTGSDTPLPSNVEKVFHLMSHQTTPQPSAAGGNFTAFVITLTVLFFALVWVLNNSAPAPRPQGEGLSVAWVQTQASVPLPTDTPLPTLEPTSTPRPRAFSPDPQRIRTGQTAFQTTCSSCHGFDGQGVSGLGPSMMGNTFIDSQSNQELLAFIISGRPSDHPDNTTGITMPARGGNAALADNEIASIIHYIRSINPDTVVYDVRPDGAAPQAPVVEVVAATPTVFQTVAAIEFKPIDLGSLGGGSSATATPTP
jgi:mono/diheme cytochrome c family protein